MRFLLAMLLCWSAASQAGDRFRDRHDETRNRIWQLTRTGVVVHDPGRTTRIPLPEWTYAGPPFGCAPDIALGPNGEAIVSSDVVPVLWRIDPRTFVVSRYPLTLDADRGKDVGFRDLSWVSARTGYLAVSTADGARWQIDAALRTARKVSSPARPVAAPTCRDGASAAGPSPAHGRRSRPW